MDIRLLTDYMRRYWPGFGLVIPCYICLAAYTATQEEFYTLIIFSYLTLYTMEWYFLADQRLNTRRIVQTLPIKRAVLSRTLWFKAVINPIIIGCSTMIPGIIACHFTAPGVYDAGDLACYVLTALLLTNGWSIYLAFFNQKQSGLITESICGLLFIGYCVFCFYLAYIWSSSLMVKILVSSASILLSTWGFRFAPRFLDKMVEQKPSDNKHEDICVQTRDFNDQDTEISWYDALLARPVLSLIAGSFLMIIINLGICGITGLLIDSRVRVEIIFLGSLILSTIVLTKIIRDFYFSLRVFSNLPISRTRLSVYCILLPFIAFFPIAACSFFDFFLFMVLYEVAIAIFIGATVLGFQWNSMIALVFSISMLLLLYLWPVYFFILSRPGNNDIDMIINAVGISFFALIMIISIIWLWLLLRYSNAPYRKKPEFNAV